MYQFKGKVCMNACGDLLSMQIKMRIKNNNNYNKNGKQINNQCANIADNYA